MYLKKISTVLFAILLLASCNKDDSLPEPTQEEILQIELKEQEAALRKFEKVITKAQATIQKKSEEIGPIQNDEMAQQLLTSVSSASITFMEEYGFTNDDYYEMFGTNNIFEMQNQIAIAGIWLYALQKNKLINPDIRYIKGAPDPIDCFFEATGINTLREVINTLQTGNLNTSTVISLLKKVVIKIGGKAIPYFGQVAMVVDFIICMSVENEGYQTGSQPNPTDFKCMDLLQVKLLNSNKIVLLSSYEVGISTEVINPYKYYTTYNVVYGNGNIDVDDITTATPCEVTENTGREATIKGLFLDKHSLKQYLPLNAKPLPDLLRL